MTLPPNLASLTDFRNRLAAAPDPSTEARAQAEARNHRLTKPPHALGRLEELATLVCLLARRCAPPDRKPAGGGVRRQSRGDGAGRFGVPGRGNGADGAELPGRGRGDQPDG